MNCFVCNAALPEGTGKVVAVGFSDLRRDRRTFSRTNRYVRTCDNCERVSGMDGRAWHRHIRIMFAKQPALSGN